MNGFRQSGPLGVSLPTDGPCCCFEPPDRPEQLPWTDPPPRLQTTVKSPAAVGAPPAKNPPAAPPPPPTAKAVADAVNKLLTDGNFDLPMVADTNRAFYKNELLTLEAITDKLLPDVVKQLPGASRDAVSKALAEAYAAKQKEHEESTWQLGVQVLYTPQYTLWASQTPTSPWAHSFQASFAANKRHHLYSYAGWESTFQINGGFFNLGSDNNYWFQNALLAYQLAYVGPLGREFRLPGMTQTWSNLQGSVFGSVGAGLSATPGAPPADKKLFMSFIGQPSLGGQITLNIGSIQIILQGAAVYTWASRTIQIGSIPSGNAGVQLGTGIGAQF